MRRRNALLGLGGLAGVAGAVGSGAFTSVAADRTVSVAVADDANALLRLRPSDGPNGAYASTDGGVLGLEFSETDAGGDGVGTDSVYRFDDVFRIENQGTQAVYVWTVTDADGSSFEPGDVAFYASDNGTPLTPGDHVPQVATGEELAVGVAIDTSDLDTDQTLRVVVRGDVTPPTETGDDPGDGSSTIQRRARDEFRTRTDAAKRQLLVAADTSPHPSNGRVTTDAVVTKFGKSLAHDETTGLPTTAAYGELVDATRTGGTAVGYGEITQAFAGATGSEVPDDVTLVDGVDGGLDSRPLVQPETAWTYLTAGGSTATLRIARPPAFGSDTAGAEMIELYWRALTRDVNFRDYDTDSDVQAAAEELAATPGYRGPGSDRDPNADQLGTGTVFRGVTPGSQTGPYVSQFLWKDRPLGGGVEDQRIEIQAPGSDYMTSVSDWLKIQRGISPSVDETLPGNELSGERYIVTGRDLCERVHDDPPFRQVQKATQVLIFGMNVPLDDGIPYTLRPFDGASQSRRNVSAFTSQTTSPFNDFGPLYVEKSVMGATEVGQKMAWHKKWNVHRRLRPEEYGGRLEATRDGSELAEPADVDYESLLPDHLLTADALAETEDRFGTYLLPQAYAEGSPTHPSYPAGHSVVAGAGVTVLKALFDGDYVFSTDEKVVPTRNGQTLETADETTAMGVDETLTVRGELNKLASNMALGRNRAGIHYRTDGIEGLRLGERAAVRYLEDRLSLPRHISGYDSLQLSLETFDGERVTITPTV